MRKTRKAIFLEQMDRVVPWSRLVDLIAPHYPAGRTGRPPFGLETMLRTHFLQQWFNLSDPAMEEAFFDTPLYREFVGLLDNVRLTFRWKDYRVKGKTRHKTMTLEPEEFMRRFLLHVLPGGFHRIRHYGLIAKPLSRIWLPRCIPRFPPSRFIRRLPSGLGELLQVGARGQASYKRLRTYKS